MNSAASSSSNSIVTMDEEIFVLVNYKKKSNYIKVCFKYNDEYHLVMVREAISAAFGNMFIDNCNFYWEDALIIEKDLVPLIKAKKNCGHFKLNVKTNYSESVEDNQSDSDFNDNPVYRNGELSAAKFKEFMSADVQTKLLLRDDPTEPSVRRSIIDVAVRYLFQECGTLPTANQRDAMMKVVCDVFKPLRSDEVLVMKWIQEKIKNVRWRMRQGNARNNSRLLGKRSYDEVEEKNTIIEDQIKYLEACTDDAPKVENALRETLKYRMDQCGQSDFSVFNTYKFFSKSLDLILFDFSIRFPMVPDNLLENFESFLDAACNIYRTETKEDLPEEDCLLGIRKLLTICHYTKTPTAPKTPAYRISQMMEDFITFSTMDEDRKPEFKEHPIIVAQGSSKKAIWKYFLQIEDVLLELPQQTKFIGAFDYLLRSYYVFNVEFPKTISVFLNFLMVNVYEISVKSKYDQKKANIEDLHTRSREFLRKVQKCLQLRNEIKIQFL